MDEKIREALEDAWENGFEAGYDLGYHGDAPAINPYRKEDN